MCAHFSNQRSRRSHISIPDRSISPIIRSDSRIAVRAYGSCCATTVKVLVKLFQLVLQIQTPESQEVAALCYTIKRELQKSNISSLALADLPDLIRIALAALGRASDFHCLNNLARAVPGQPGFFLDFG